MSVTARRETKHCLCRQARALQSIAQPRNVPLLTQTGNIDKPIHIVSRAGRRFSAPSCADDVDKDMGASFCLPDPAHMSVGRGASGHIPRFSFWRIKGPLLQEERGFAVARWKEQQA